MWQAVFLFAGSTVLAKWLALSAFMLVFFRWGVSFLYFLFTKRSRKRLPKKTLLFLLILWTTLFIDLSVFYTALNMTSLSIAEIGRATGPMFMLFLETIIYKQKIWRAHILLAVTTMVWMAILFPDISLEQANITWLLLAVLSWFIYACRMLLLRHVTRLSDPTTAIFWQSFVMMLLALPFIAWELQNLPVQLLPRLLLFGVAWTAIPNVFVARALIQVRPYVVTLVMNTVPFFAILLSLFVFDDKLTAGMIIWWLLILACGVYASHYEYYNRPKGL